MYKTLYFLNIWIYAMWPSCSCLGTINVRESLFRNMNVQRRIWLAYSLRMTLKELEHYCEVKDCVLQNSVNLTWLGIKLFKYKEWLVKESNIGKNHLLFLFLREYLFEWVLAIAMLKTPILFTSTENSMIVLIQFCWF